MMPRLQTGKMARRLLPLTEPRLLFRHGQKLDDPKDGLLLFGPPDVPIGIQYGVIGLPASIDRFEKWSAQLIKATPADPDIKSSLMFPGFEPVFRTAWPGKARVRLGVDEAELGNALRNTDSHQRVYDAVELFAGPIARWIEEEDPAVSLWFVVVTEDLWKLCRPKSRVSRKDGVPPDVHLSHKQALDLLKSPDLFDNANEAAEKHRYENHFHNQLKARLLDCQAVTQVIRETTIAPREFLNQFGKPTRRVQDAATIAWNLSTSAYYKSGAKPWSLADIRDGVCYIGLIFKRTNNPMDETEACCGAQMFLHTGEGVIFKGSVGPWQSGKRGEFHLPRQKAAEIIKLCVESYKQWHGNNPSELFIHGRTRFNKEEVAGFQDGAPDDTDIAGIQIYRPNDLKLYRDGRRAVLRGVALEIDERNAFVWTSGYIPKLLTYPGREVPTPLRVRIVFGDVALKTVLADILALTKLNFNCCIYGDGFPVTLRFADDVGEILTAIPDICAKPLPFRHYI
ncbi:MAG TPA: hypothetical protein PKK10_08310 [Woeseiaceae bacterium]|nr:hypothetical protein [Woeseiaceae bacterium]